MISRRRNWTTHARVPVARATPLAHGQHEHGEPSNPMAARPLETPTILVDWLKVDHDSSGRFREERLDHAPAYTVEAGRRTSAPPPHIRRSREANAPGPKPPTWRLSTGDQGGRSALKRSQRLLGNRGTGRPVTNPAGSAAVDLRSWNRLPMPPHSRVDSTNMENRPARSPLNSAK